MLLNKLNDLIERAQDGDLLVVLELEYLLIPACLDGVELGLDLGFLLCSVYELCYLLGVSVELELDQIIKAELWRVECDALLGGAHEPLPVPLLHELRVKL